VRCDVRDVFDHVLLTRFNVKLGQCAISAVGEEWLIHRMDLFERYCLPAVAAQTNKNFRWLIFIDPLTPFSIRKRLLANQNVQHFELCPISEFYSSEMPRWFSPTNSDFLISSRLDNDDIIHETFIHEVQTCFSGQSFQWINFSSGYIFDEMLGFFASRQTSGPFLSLIERVPDPGTVYCINHRHAARLGPVHQIDSKPMWIQLAHERNVSNRVQPGLRPVTPDLNGFHLGESAEVFRREQGPLRALVP
jgi:hypothetical protein